MNIYEQIPEELRQRYEFYNYGHALEILLYAFPTEWKNIMDCLSGFTLTRDDILKAGGNESPIPKKIDTFLYPEGWREIRIEGDLVVKEFVRQAGQRRAKGELYEEKIVSGFIDGHNIDFIKGRVALDLEWNSKDQTYDRDLLAMRTYHECGIVDVGVILTRAENLNSIFSELGVKAKYGASTTWMGKLLYRLDNRRNGGCPVLAIGIRAENVVD